MGYAGTLKFDTKISGDGFKKGVSELQTAAKGALVAIGSALTTAAVSVALFGSQMETGMAKVSTMLTGSSAECAGALQQIEGQLLKTSTATGQSASALAEAAYQALSAGVAVEKAGAFTDKAAKLAIGGFTTTEGAVDALSSIINAYGEEVIDVDKASKILMQTQNKGKTTIDQLAHSISQVTPTAAAMQVSFDQVGASLATMTAQGVPTAQATTQLNQLFADLGKSGTQAANSLAAATEGTQHAGKNFSELMAAGVPLSDLLLLMSDYATQNGKSLIDMFGSIESGKAALSLINNEGKTFTDNLTAMGTQADVVDAAYSKMMDTFAKKKDVFIESAKNVGIAAYKHIEQPLKDAADAGIEWMNKLLKIMQKDGDKIVTVLKNIAIAAAAAVSAMVAFKGASIVGAVFEKISGAVKAASATLKLYTAAIAANAAMETRGITVGKLLASTLDTKTVLLGAVTGKIDLATAATTLFGKAMVFITAHPIVLVATAVAALTAGIVALTLAQQNNKTEAELALEAAKKQHEQIQQNAQAYRDLKEASFESASADLAKLDHVSALSRELNGLADASGFVAEKDRARVSFILGEMNGALGTECEMIDGVIQKRGELAGSVENLISLKRAEILLSAQEGAYEEALTKLAEAQKTVADTRIAMGQTQAEIDTIEAQRIQELTTLETIRGLGVAATVEQHRVAGLILTSSWYAELEARRATLTEEGAAYESAKLTAQQYNADISSYETAAGFIATGETLKAIDLMEQKNAAYLTHTGVVAQSSTEQQQLLGQQYANQLVQLDEYIAAYSLGMDGYTLEGVQKLQEAAVQCGEEARIAGVAIVDGQIEGIDGKKIDLNNEITTLRDNGIEILGQGTQGWYNKGVDAGQGYANGIISQLQNVRNSTSLLVDAGEGSLAKRQKSASPAKVFIKQGSYAGQGYAVGMVDEIPNVQSAAAAMAESAIPAATGVSFTSLAQDFASKIRRTSQAYQQRAAASVPVQSVQRIVTPQTESIVPAISSAIAAAFSSGIKCTVSAPLVTEINGREILKCTKEAEATFGYNVGGMQHAW